jgi:hypothetical protein
VEGASYASLFEVRWITIGPMRNWLNRNVILFLSLFLPVIVGGGARADAGEPLGENEPSVNPGIDERPLIREKSGLHYLAPKPVSPGEPHDPFIKPDYYQAPVPPTEKYREAPPEQSVPPAGKAPPGGRLTPLP